MSAMKAPVLSRPVPLWERVKAHASTYLADGTANGMTEEEFARRVRDLAARVRAGMADNPVPQEAAPALTHEDEQYRERLRALAERVEGTVRLPCGLKELPSHFSPQEAADDERQAHATARVQQLLDEARRRRGTASVPDPGGASGTGPAAGPGQ